MMMMMMMICFFLNIFIIHYCSYDCDYDDYSHDSDSAMI